MKANRRKLLLISFGIPALLISEIRSILFSFTFALFLAACLQGLIHRCKKYHIPSAITVFSVLILVIVPVAVVLGYGLYRMISATAWALSEALPILRGSVNLEQWLYRTITALPPNIQQLIQQAVDAVLAQSDLILTNITAKLAAWSTGFISALPSHVADAGLFLLFFLFCAFSYAQVKQLLLALLPADWSNWIRTFLQTAKVMLQSWCSAEGKLVLLIFIELSIGLRVLGTHGWLWFALCTAIIDMIPFVGSGLLLLPWALFQFITGRQLYAIGLVLLWIVVWITRTLLEPKLIGTQLHLPSSVSFLSAIIGIRVLGIKGLILFPVFTSVAVTLLSGDKLSAAQRSGAQKD